VESVDNRDWPLRTRFARAPRRTAGGDFMSRRPARDHSIGGHVRKCSERAGTSSPAVRRPTDTP
jgi:hypothetical protein